MHAHTAVKTLSAAALVGGVSLGVGLTSPASAMRLDAGGTPTPSIGAQCQAARAALSTTNTTSTTSGDTTAGEDTSPAPSLIPGKPGLRCGQVFGKAHGHVVTSPDESAPVPTTPVPTTSTDEPSTPVPTTGDDETTKPDDDATESEDFQSDDDGVSKTQSFSGWTGAHHHRGNHEHHGDQHDD